MAFDLSLRTERVHQSGRNKSKCERAASGHYHPLLSSQHPITFDRECAYTEANFLKETQTHTHSPLSSFIYSSTLSHAFTLMLTDLHVCTMSCQNNEWVMVCIFCADEGNQCRK